MTDVDKLIKDFFAKMKWTAKMVSEGVYIFQKDGKTFTLQLTGETGVELHRRVFLANGVKTPDAFQKKVGMWTARLSGLENIDPEQLEFNLGMTGFSMTPPEPGGRAGLIVKYKVGDMGDLKSAIESEENFKGYCNFLTEFTTAVEEVEKAG